MDKDLRHIKKQFPVLVNNNYNYTMAEAEIFRKPDQLLIQIVSEGPDSQVLAEFLEQDAPIALSFIAIPVQNITEKRENI